MKEDVICDKKDICRDYPKMCSSCKNNKKKSYYEPEDINPWIPWRNPYEPVWYCDNIMWGTPEE